MDSRTVTYDPRTALRAAEPAPSSATPEASIAGRYRLKGELGEGGFGRVFRAWDAQLKREVALKVARPRSGGGNAHHRFFLEARAAAQLRHPNIVPVFDAGEADGIAFIAAELIDGVTLKDRCRTGPPFTCSESAQVVARLAGALHYAHAKGVIHRDVKPANILITGDGEPHLTDFGLARWDHAEELRQTQAGTHLGTPAYMSPEQASGQSHEATPQSDVWSVGVVLYELLTGALPFDETTTHAMMRAILEIDPPPLRTRDPAIPRDLETICLKCLAKEPRARYATAQALADDLNCWLRFEPIKARRVSLPERGARWVRRNPLLTGLLVTLAVGSATSTYLAGKWRNESLHSRTATDTAERHRLTAERNLTDRNTAFAQLNAAHRDLQRQTARSQIDKAEQEFARGEIGRGLLWLARARETLPPDATDLQAVVERNMLAWHRRLHRLNVMVGPQAVGPQSFERAFFTRDDRAVCVRDRNRIWTLDALTGKPLAAPLELSGVPTSLDRGEGERTVVVSFSGKTAEGEIAVWNLVTREQVGRSIRVSGGIARIVVDAGGRVALTQSGDFRSQHPLVDEPVIRVWDLATGELTKTLAAEKGQPIVWLHALSPDGKFVALQTGSPSRQFRVYELPSGKPVSKVARDLSSSCAFFASGQVLAVSRDYGLSFAESESGKTVYNPWIHPRRESIREFTLSPDGQHLLLLDTNAALQLFGLTMSRFGGAEVLGQPLFTGSAAFNGTGRTLAIASSSELRIWDLSIGERSEPSSRTGPLTAERLQCDCGMRLTPTGEFQELSAEDWWTVTERVPPLGK